MDADIASANSIESLEKLLDQEKVKCKAYVETCRIRFGVVPQSIQEDAQKAQEDAFGLVENKNYKLLVEPNCASTMYRFVFRLSQIEIKLSLIRDLN